MQIVTTTKSNYDAKMDEISRANTAKLNANLAYVAMMTDVELPEDSESGEPMEVTNG